MIITQTRRSWLAFGKRSDESFRWLGLIRRRTAWLPTAKGLLLLAVILGGLCHAFVLGIHPFLAPERPVEAEVFVAEGWIPDYALKHALDMCVERNAALLLLTGGAVRSGINPEPDDNYANLALKRLQRIGGDLRNVRSVPSSGSASGPVRDRTYASALAVNDWLRKEKIPVNSINVVTMGAHARRSRLLFKMALGPEAEVGVIPIANRDYDPQHWWRFSEGVKEVLSEGAAYLYARFLFNPD